MTNEQTCIGNNASYQVPKLKAPASDPIHKGVELDTSLTSLGWLQNMSIGASPSGFGGTKVVGHQVERRKVYKTVPSAARPPHPKSAPVQKTANAGSQSTGAQRPKSAPMLGCQPGSVSSSQQSAKPQEKTPCDPVAGEKPEMTATSSAKAVHPPLRMKEEHQRPPYTYAVLVHMALSDFPNQTGSLMDIGQWMIKTYPFFEKKNGNNNWIEVIKSNVKAIGHATYNSETDQWTLLPHYRDYYKSPAAIKKRGSTKPPRKNKMRSPSLNSLNALDAVGDGEFRWSAAGTLELSKSQTALVAPKGKQQKSKGKKRSNSVSYQSVASLIPKGSSPDLYRNLALPDTPVAGSVTELLRRADVSSNSDAFDWATMAKLNGGDAPFMVDVLAPTAQPPTSGEVSDMMRHAQGSVFDEFPTNVTDMELESCITGMLNSSAGINDLSMNDNYEPLMDSNLLTSDWTVAF